MECDSGRAPGRFPERTFLCPRQEGMYAVKSSHRSKKVQWKHFIPEEATWEMEDKM